MCDQSIQALGARLCASSVYPVGATVPAKCTVSMQKVRYATCAMGSMALPTLYTVAPQSEPCFRILLRALLLLPPIAVRVAALFPLLPKLADF